MCSLSLRSILLLLLGGFLALCSASSLLLAGALGSGIEQFDVALVLHLCQALGALLVMEPRGLGTAPGFLAAMQVRGCAVCVHLGRLREEAAAVCNRCFLPLGLCFCCLLGSGALTFSIACKRSLALDGDVQSWFWVSQDCVIIMSSSERPV